MEPSVSTTMSVLGSRPETLDRAGTAQHELDQLGEKADPGLLRGRGIPALEDGDQPVRVAGAGRRATPVRVRQQQVQRPAAGTSAAPHRWRPGRCAHRPCTGCRCRCHGTRASQAGARPSATRVEAVAAAGVAAMASGGLGVAVQADADADAEAPERGSSIGRPSRVPLVCTPMFTWAGIWARSDSVSSVSHSGPASSGSPPCRMTSTLGRSVLPGVLTDALDGLVGYRPAHPPGQTDATPGQPFRRRSNTSTTSCSGCGSSR